MLFLLRVRRSWVWYVRRFEGSTRCVRHSRGIVGKLQVRTGLVRGCFGFYAGRGAKGMALAVSRLPFAGATVRWDVRRCHCKVGRMAGRGHEHRFSIAFRGTPPRSRPILRTSRWNGGSSDSKCKRFKKEKRLEIAEKARPGRWNKVYEDVACASGRGRWKPGIKKKWGSCRVVWGVGGCWVCGYIRLGNAFYFCERILWRLNEIRDMFQYYCWIEMKKNPAS
jgi:hypothetical protein